MIVVFYDKDFNALQNNASLNVGKWELRKKAVDFNDFSFTSEPFIENVNPCFVVMKDDYGRKKHCAFAGVPQLNKENQTECQASDLKTIFNNEVLLQFGNYTHIDNMFSYLFTQFNLQVMQGSFALEIDMTDLSTVQLDLLKPLTDLKVYNVWNDILVPYMKFYDLYITSDLDLVTKKLIFTIKRTNLKTLPLRLWEMGIKNYGKWISSLNETQSVVSVNGVLNYGEKFILLSNNAITNNATLRDLYPIKRNLVLKETEDSSKLADLIIEGNVEAIEKLVSARFNESIEIDTQNIQSYEEADFGTQFEVYTKKNDLYKTLPLGEIYENQDGEKKLKIGYKADNLLFYI